MAHQLTASNSVRRLALLLAVAAVPLTALAGPEGSRVVSGAATITRSGRITTIEAANNTILDHAKFNVGPRETVRFVQPNSHARVLNRITGGKPTVIEGRLLANGSVYFLNPKGIYFSGTSRIDVANLYAAAGHLADESFLSGVDRFNNLTGSVINDGAIVAQRAHLVGKTVANHGSINANVVTMLAGDKVYLKERDARLTVEVDDTNLASGRTPPSSSGPAAVENTGTITAAPRGKIFLGAGDLYSLAIRNRGQITAPAGAVTLAAKSGAVVNDGTITAPTASDHPGAIRVTAPSILNRGALSADAASGAAGTIDVVGTNHTLLPPGSRISASSKGGPGGRVIVNSLRGQTIFARDSTIDVSGTTAGGFAEVSGKYLSFHGSANVGDGQLLVDPRDLRIVETGTHDSEAADGSIGFNDPDPDTDVTVSASALESLTGEITLQATRDLIIDAPVQLENDNRLTIEAGRDLIFNASVSGADRLFATADADANGSGSILFNSFPLTISTARDQDYTGPVLLNNDARLVASRVKFRSPVDSTGKSARSLEITGSVDFEAPVGSDAALSNLTIAGTANLRGGSITTTGEQDYQGNVNLQDHTSLSASLVHFHFAIDDARAGTTPGREADLLVDADAIFDSRVTSLRFVGSLHVTGTSAINGESVTTVRDQIYDQPVTVGKDTVLASIGGNIRFFDTLDSAEGTHVALDVSARFGHIQFGDVGALRNLGSLTAVAGVQAGKIITVNGERVIARGDIELNPKGAPLVPTIATIAAPDGDVAVISREGNVLIGPRNKFTAVGDLTINAPNGSAAVGDLNAFGDLRVSARTIRLLARAPGEILDFQGDLNRDLGLDFVANGAFRFDGDIVVDGTGPAPRFGTPSATPDLLGTLSPFDIVAIAPVSREAFTFNDTVLDLTIVPLPEPPPPPPPASEDPADEIPRGPIPFADRVNREPVLGPAGRAALRRVAAVDTRTLSEAEYQESLAFRQFYNDLVENLRPDDAAARPVAVNRIRRASALAALNEYETIFVSQTTDPQTGTTTTIDLTPRIKSAVAAAYDDYRREAAPAATTFPAYLAQNEGHAAAREYVSRIAALLAAVQRVGVTDLEFQGAVDAVLTPIAPEGVTPRELYGEIVRSEARSPATRPATTPASP